MSRIWIGKFMICRCLLQIKKHIVESICLLKIVFLTHFHQEKSIFTNTRVGSCYNTDENKISPYFLRHNELNVQFLKLTFNPFNEKQDQVVENFDQAAKIPSKTEFGN